MTKMNIVAFKYFLNLTASLKTYASLPRHFRVHTLRFSTLMMSQPRPLIWDIKKRNVSVQSCNIQQKDSMLETVRKNIKLQFRKYKLRAAGYYLYESIADVVDYNLFINELRLPDTFSSWFLITELHVWMLMARFMADPFEGRFVRNCIVEALWQDVSTRAKKLGSEHASVIKKQILILNEEFQASLVIYDEGLLSHDRVLANALWRRLFNQECEDIILLESMVKYVRQTMYLLDRTPLDQLFSKKKFEWITMKELFFDLPKI